MKEPNHSNYLIYIYINNINEEVLNKNVFKLDIIDYLVLHNIKSQLFYPNTLVKVG